MEVVEPANVIEIWASLEKSIRGQKDTLKIIKTIASLENPVRENEDLQVSREGITEFLKLLKNESEYIESISWGNSTFYHYYLRLGNKILRLSFEAEYAYINEQHFGDATQAEAYIYDPLTDFKQEMVDFDRVRFILHPIKEYDLNSANEKEKRDYRIIIDPSNYSLSLIDVRSNELVEHEFVHTDYSSFDGKKISEVLKPISLLNLRKGIHDKTLQVLDEMKNASSIFKSAYEATGSALVHEKKEG